MSRPGYPYLTVARLIDRPYGLVLSYVDWLELNRARGGVRIDALSYWQQRAIDELSNHDKAMVQAAWNTEHVLRLKI